MKNSITAVLLAGFALFACGDTPVEQIPASPEISLSPDSVVLNVYTAAPPLAVTVRDGNGAIQYDASLIYASRDQSVATVNASGAISAVAVGSTYVVVRLTNKPDVRDSVRVRVYDDFPFTGTAVPG